MLRIHETIIELIRELASGDCFHRTARHGSRSAAPASDRKCCAQRRGGFGTARKAARGALRDRARVGAGVVVLSLRRRRIRVRQCSARVQGALRSRQRHALHRQTTMSRSRWARRVSGPALAFIGGRPRPPPHVKAHAREPVHVRVAPRHGTAAAAFASACARARARARQPPHEHEHEHAHACKARFDHVIGTLCIVSRL